MSTDTSPALNGKEGNHERLKDELAEMGVFDSRMSIYLPYRQRFFAVAGYAGFEGRYYSLFANMENDMAEAVDLQNLITALACRYALSGKVMHHDIPDKPSIESERRQIFFGCAVGIPTFYVRKDTANRFLRKILTNVTAQRSSRRYRGYTRVNIDDYRQALVRVLYSDAADLIESLDLSDRMHSLEQRLSGVVPSSFDQIIDEVTHSFKRRKNALQVPANDFNTAMEHYYRTTLKREHLVKSLELFSQDCRELEKIGDPMLKHVLAESEVHCSCSEFIAKHRPAIIDETASEEILEILLRIGIAVIHYEQNESQRTSSTS
jgi:hypothetical protein